MRRIAQFLLDRPVLIVLILIGIIMVCMELDTIVGDAIGVKPVSPKITVKNVSPCSRHENKWVSVEDLRTDDKQYICANLESDTYPIKITLLIYKGNDISPFYITDNEFTDGDLSFQVFLPAGKYKARIMYVRTPLAETRFNVYEK